MKIAILGNTNTELLRQHLTLENEIYQPPGYNAWAQEVLGEQNGLASFDPQAMVFVLDGDEIVRNSQTVEAGIRELDSAIRIINTARDKFPKALKLISNLDIPLRRLLPLRAERPERLWERHWNEALSAMSMDDPSVLMLDLKLLVERTGRALFYSSKFWYLGGVRYSVRGFGALAKVVDQVCRAWQGKRKKCLVLDLDNTLWGKVLGEEDIEGIELSEEKEGARYKDFQRRIKELKETGAILAIVSKNNFEDAIDVIRNHPHMVLRENDFSALKINWEPKPVNIVALAKELNIGLDTFVFIDDNPVERAAVETACPGVTVLGFPKDTAQLEFMMTDAFYEYFLPIAVTDEDKNRTAMYRSEFLRSEARQAAESIEKFLQSLEMSLVLRSVDKADVERVAQLTQKTNQFNVTTRRYSAADIENRIGSPNWRVFAASLTDRFGDNGIISVLMAEVKGSVAVIDTFLLSCRVMGRRVEDAIIAWFEKSMLEEGREEIHAEYIPTPKNVPVRDLFDKLGYGVVRENEDGSKQYILGIKGQLPRRICFADIRCQQ